jgi:hypothetical protein
MVSLDFIAIPNFKKGNEKHQQQYSMHEHHAWAPGFSPLTMTRNRVAVLVEGLPDTLGSERYNLIHDAAVTDGGDNPCHERGKNICQLSATQATVRDEICWCQRPWDCIQGQFFPSSAQNPETRILLLAIFVDRKLVCFSWSALGS